MSNVIKAILERIICIDCKEGGNNGKKRAVFDVGLEEVSNDTAIVVIFDS